MKLSEIAATLREIGVSPVKSLGQNFLHDQNLARWIVEQADIGPEDFVVEIGPGLGALTGVILAKGAPVLAIEKDKRLVEFLRSHFSDARLELLHADALDLDVRTLFARPRAKLIGNLPYKIASQLLLKYLAHPTPFSLVILTLQKEMAQRIGAEPASKNYGALSVQIQFHYRVKYLRTISAGVFFPEPEVDSAVVVLLPRGDTELPACDSKLFGELVRRGFSQRRKQLGKLVHDYVEDWPKAAETLGLDRQVRAESLALEQWIALTNHLRPMGTPDLEKLAVERFPVVDEKDVVLRAAPRAEVHGNNLLHRAVHALIFNAAGEVYLQLRSRLKDRHPLRWDSSAAGHVNADEDYDQTATREVSEELGIEIPLKRVLKLPASERTDYEFVWLYRGLYDGELRPNPGEIEAIRSFPPRIVDRWIEARPRDFAPGFVECWKIWRKRNA